MYDRFYVWQVGAIAPAHTEEAWANEFTLKTACIDIRFTLIGYGWKPNQADENIPILYQGEYKCYYRAHGSGDPWTLFSRATCERAPTDTAYVYEDIAVASGVLPEGIYDIRIEANRAPEFEAWGGCIEDIEKGHAFYGDLQIRAEKPIPINVYEEIAAPDVLDIARDIIDLVIAEDIIGYDRLDNYNIGYQAQITENIITVSEYKAFFFDTYRQLFEVINTVEYVEFWTTLLHMATPREDLTVTEVLTGVGLPWLILPILIDSINNTEYAIAAVTPIWMPLFYEQITIDDVIVLWPEPPWHPRPYETLSILESIEAFAFRWVLQDECQGTIGNWSQQLNGTDHVVEESPIGSFHVKINKASNHTSEDVRLYWTPPYKYITLTGTVTLTNGSVNVLGSGTHFLTEVQPVPYNPWIPLVLLPNGVVAGIQTVTDDTHMQFYAAGFYTGTTGAGQIIQLQTGEPDPIPFKYDAEIEIYFNGPINGDAGKSMTYNLMGLTLYINPQGNPVKGNWYLVNSNGDTIMGTQQDGLLDPLTTYTLRVRGQHGGVDGDADVWWAGVYKGRWRNVPSGLPVSIGADESYPEASFVEGWLNYAYIKDLSQQTKALYIFRQDSITVTEARGVTKV